jgi:hypothetical protein
MAVDEDAYKVHPWHIRATRGLNAFEKVFLHTVLSRGDDGMFTSAQTAADDMGMSLWSFYRVRKELVRVNLITVQEYSGSTSQYWINAQRLHAGLAKQQGLVPGRGGSSVNDSPPLVSDTRPPLVSVRDKEEQEEEQEEELEEEPEDTNVILFPAGGRDG